MNIKMIARSCTLLFCAASFSAAAEDIDLFMADHSTSVIPPNVLFVLDNSANWDASLFKQGSVWVSKKDVLHEALYTALTDPANKEGIAAGFTAFTSKTGAKVMAAVKTLTSDYQRALGSKIYNATAWRPATALALNTYVLPNYSSDSAIAANHWTGHYYQVTTAGTTGATEPAWPINGGTITDGTAKIKDMGSVYGATVIQRLQKSNNAPYALSLHESYLYYRGDAPLNGLADADYDHDAYSSATGKYVSPNAAQQCEKNFVVVIGNGGPDSGENTDSYNKLWQLYKDNGVTAAPMVLPLNPNNYAGNWGDEYAGFFTSVGDANKVETGKQQLTTYVIAIYDTTKAVSTLTKPEQGALAYLSNIAEQGKGRYFAAGNTQELSAALRKIVDEVKSVNSVFASTTLPVSINVRGTNLNQVYMGVFRPDKDKHPAWYGNLKMYKLGYDAATENVYLADSKGKRADSAVTGFITTSAASFWTHTTDSSVYSVAGAGETQWWWWKPQGTNADPKSDYEDGDVVEKGGAGQWLREHPAERRLYTCHTCAPGAALEDFDSTHITTADLGVSTTTERDAIVDFIMGDNSTLADGKEKVRSMVHGDVLHSRPATINYGPNNDDVVTYYGANDGVFHAVKGGESADSWGFVVGEEVWGFVPPELFKNLTKLKTNTPIDSSHPKPYFVDGTIMTLRWADKNYVYLTMRRGARAIYALNVNDASAGYHPTVAWRKRDTELPELGYTWSDPNIYLAKITSGTTTQTVPVIVMGAGYDTAEDIDVTTGSSDTVGRGVYVLNALTGDLIKFLGNTSKQTTNAISVDVVDSIPGAVKSAGNLDRTTGLQTITTAYTADTGGNIWRLDLSSTNPDLWTMTKMATLGGTGADNRKFLYHPDVVNRTVGYTAVLIGSGDREHPHDTSVQNYFFILKDYYEASKNTGWPLDINDLQLPSVYSETEAQGCKLPLTGAGEKAVGNAVTMNGVVFFNTNIPYVEATSVCTPSLGEARAYSINLQCGCEDPTGTCYVVPPGGGFLPSPVPFTVDIDGTTVSGIISGTQVDEPPQPRYGHTTHQFWYKKGTDK
jgi:type IV pilus assembly protein PilY1